MFQRLTTTQKGILAAFLGFSGFSFADACAKWLGAYYDTMDILFWTYLICFIFGLCISPWLGGVRETLRTKKLIIHVCRGACALVIGVLVITSLSQGLPLATLYTVLFLSPFLTTIAAIPAYKEHVSFKSWLIILIGFSGVLVAFYDPDASISLEAVYALCALVFIVGLWLLARPLAQGETLLSLSFYPSLTTVILTFGSSFFSIELPELSHVPIFILNGMFVTFGLTGIFYGFSHAPYAIVAPVHYSQIIWALILGYFIFSDIPDLRMLAGAVIIISSGIMLVFSQED